MPILPIAGENVTVRENKTTYIIHKWSQSPHSPSVSTPFMCSPASWKLAQCPIQSYKCYIASIWALFGQPKRDSTWMREALRVSSRSVAGQGCQGFFWLVPSITPSPIPSATLAMALYVWVQKAGSSEAVSPLALCLRLGELPPGWWLCGPNGWLYSCVGSWREDGREPTGVFFLRQILLIK